MLIAFSAKVSDLSSRMFLISEASRLPLCLSNDCDAVSIQTISILYVIVSIFFCPQISHIPLKHQQFWTIHKLDQGFCIGQLNTDTVSMIVKSSTALLFQILK